VVRPGALTALAALALAAPAAAEVATVAGAWELGLEGSHRKCRIVLAADENPFGRAVRFPAGCRRALPILGKVSGWTVEGGRVRLVGLEGTVLAFEREDEDLHRARSAEETYRLESPQRQVREARLPEPPPLGVPQATPVDPETAPPVASVPGVYVVDRYLERDVCRIELGLVPAGERLQARLLDGCRDLGLSAFDPTSWRYVAGRLTLTSRRGHEVTLISERAGQWRRDPEVGATLVLRKAP
jgi:hypothetical protein